MGVYIDMEMPKGKRGKRIIIFPNGAVVELIAEYTYDGDLHTVKAIPVPAHGRLIDADALIKVFKTKAKNPLNQETAPYSWAFAYECLADVVGDMPTIIHAEPREEETT